MSCDTDRHLQKFQFKCLKIDLILGEKPNHIAKSYICKILPMHMDSGSLWNISNSDCLVRLAITFADPEGFYSCLSQQRSHFLQQFPQWLEGVPTLLSPSVRFEHLQLQMAFITLPKCDYQGWNVRQKYFSQDDSLSMIDFRFSLFGLWNFKSHYTVYCTFAAILGIFKLCLDKNPIKSSKQKQKAAAVEDLNNSANTL